jgi:hypothetical protein
MISGLSAAHCPHGHYRSQGCPVDGCADKVYCEMMCAWKGGSPCQYDKCPRRLVPQKGLDHA